MAKTKSSELPLEPLHDLLAWWKQARVPGIIIGGLAVALHGRPRVTRDVDAVILLDEARWPGFNDNILPSGTLNRAFRNNVAIPPASRRTV